MIRVALLFVLASSSLLVPARASAEDGSFGRAFSVGARTFVEIDPEIAEHAADAPEERERFVGRARGMWFYSRPPGPREAVRAQAVLDDLRARGYVRLLEPAGDHCDARVGAASILRIRSRARSSAQTTWQTDHVVVEATGCRAGSWLVASFAPVGPPAGGRLYRLDDDARGLVATASAALRSNAEATAWVLAKPSGCAKLDEEIAHTWRVGSDTFAHVILHLVGEGCEVLTVEGDLALGADGALDCVEGRPCVREPLVILPPDGLHNCPVDYDELVGYADYDGDGTIDVLELWSHYAERELTVRSFGDSTPRLRTYVAERFIGYRPAP